MCKRNRWLNVQFLKLKKDVNMDLHCTVPSLVLFYIGMCRPKGYGFSLVWVIIRVSLLASFAYSGHK